MHQEVTEERIRIAEHNAYILSKFKMTYNKDGELVECDDNRFPCSLNMEITEERTRIAEHNAYILGKFKLTYNKDGELVECDG